MTKISLPAPSLPVLINLAQLAIAAAALYLTWRGFQAGKQALKPAADAAGQLWSDVADIGRGHAEFTRAGFVLQAKHLGADGTISPMYRTALEAAHSGNKSLFQVIAPDGRLLPSYQYLVGAEVNAETVKLAQVGGNTFFNWW